MGSLGPAGGARTDFATGDMRTRVSAGDQLGALGGGGETLDPYAFIKKLRADKEAERRRAMEFDARFARGERWKDTALSAAPPSAHGEAMSAARTQADAGTLMKGRNLRDMLQTKGVLDQMTTDPVYGTNKQFLNIPAASAMTGLNLPKSGWEQYAALAKAGAPQSATAESAAQQNRLAAAGLL